MITDTHAHLDFYSEKRLSEVIENAKKNNVKLIVTNSVNKKSIQKNFEISKKYPKIVKLAVGLYPEKELEKAHLKDFKEFVLKNRKKIVALGEIGLDSHHTKENFDIQKEVFIEELKLAKKLNFPVIIHSRKAEREVLEILEKFKSIKVILHCFSGSFNLVKKGIGLGCYFSIPANIVRSEHFQKMAQVIPREKILTETDSPYLSPFKEKENEPAFITESMKKISKIWKIPETEVEKKIEDNFRKVFGF